MKVPNDPLNTILKAFLPGDTAESTPKARPVGKVENNTPEVREEILSYVGRLRVYVSDDWKTRYTRMWEDILALDVVASEVYNPGKQQGTDFNRNLVANIIHYLRDKGVYKSNLSVSDLAVGLEGDANHSVRGALGKAPEESIESRLNRYFE